MSININDLESTETNQTILDDLNISREDIYVNDVMNIPLIKGAKGDTGNTGPANKLTIGTVLDGTTASATITGESPNQVLNLVLPKGDTGSAGQNGTNGQNGQDGANGQNGSNGTTFTPSVSAEGVISFINDGGLENPTPVNIKGPAGQNGTNGTNGQGVPTGGTTGQVLGKSSNTDYDTQWQTPISVVDGFESESIENASSSKNAKVLNDKLIKISNYSTTEQLTGKWIDGKPLYRKVIEISNPTVGSWANYTHNISNLGVSFFDFGYIHRTSDDSYNTIPDFTSSTVMCKFNIDTTKVNYYIVGYSNIDTLLLCYYYTKTTD